MILPLFVIATLLSQNAWTQELDPALRALQVSTGIPGADCPGNQNTVPLTLTSPVGSLVSDYGAEAPVALPTVRDSLTPPNASCVGSRSEALLAFQRAGLDAHSAIARCPRGEGFRPLSSTHPVASVFVASRDAQYVEDLGRILARVEPSVRLNVVGGGSVTPRTSAQGRINRLNSIDSALWLQDVMESGVVGSGSRARPALYDLPYNRSEEVPTAIGGQCGVPAIRNPLLAEAGEFVGAQYHDNAANYGGNIELFPGNVLLTGTNMTPAMRAMLELGMGIPGAGESVQIDIDWLSVGHVDEILNVVPLPHVAAPCNFAVLYASPQDGMSLVQEGQRSCEAIARNQRGSIASQSTLLESCQMNPPYVGTSQGDRIRAIRENHRRLATATTSGGCLSRIGPDSRPVTASDLVHCPDFMQANQRYHQLIQQNVSMLTAAITRQTGCAQIRTVGLPTIFMPSGGANTAEFGNQGDEASSFNPGPVNGLVVNRTMIVPKQFNPLFARQVADRLRSIGIQPEFIDDRSYHSGTGEVHCGTNALRYCVP